ncbi:hypothetical protein GQ44DRAFT_740926 [Phaeosphaeriaceae sp. PMI808]|nr:hypothetical protein GQ44DRAFT_740926 [Phaeosphaeriaceae sp. PMI808]
MSSNNNTTFDPNTELADLGRARFDHDTAQITDRDSSLHSSDPVTVRPGRAPKGLENQVFAWNTFKYTTDEADDREELKGDLHEGQLHRQNRAARGEDGRGGLGMGNKNGRVDALCAGRKGEEKMPPVAKGGAEGCDKGAFWDEKIV